MSKMLDLDYSEFRRECELFDKNTFEKWEDLEEHFCTKWPAGSAGSAHNELEYMYENNGDYPPDEPWIEYWVGSGTLKAIYNYFTTHKYWCFLEYIDWVVKYGDFYEFRNVNEYTMKIRRASKRLVPKETKKELLKNANLARNSKVEYFFQGHMHLVKHPDYNFWVTPYKQIISEKGIINL